MWQESGQNTFSIYVKTDLMHKTFSYSHLNLQCKERTELNTIKNWKPLLFWMFYFISFYFLPILFAAQRAETKEGSKEIKKIISNYQLAEKK